MTTLIADRYRLDTQIGRGGMGQVWRARDLKLDRDVAVKTVDLTTLADATLEARFQQEIVTTARLNHPGIVTVFDGGVDGSTAYLVMELLTGRTLAQRIAASGPLPLAEGLDVARQVVQALAAAHAVGLVHRDIKPANVMITDGHAKLLDFGIAQLASRAGAQLTATATTIGTAAYMSPEQAAGQRVGPATDLYAVGCLLTTMFTGSPPFDGEPVAVAGMQLHQPPPRLRDRRGDLPPALDELVARLLSKSPADRPGAGETVAALTAIATGDPAAATVPLGVRPPATAVMGAPTSAAVAAGAGLAGAGGATAAGGGLAAPGAGGPVAPRTVGLGWVAGVIGVLIAALLLGGVAYSLTRQTGWNLGRIVPSAPATTPAKPSSSRPSSVRPSPTPTPSPSQSNQGSAALNAALAAVRAALRTLPDGKTKDQLLRTWDQAAKQISSGKDALKKITEFEGALDAAHQVGVVGDLQYQTIKTALAAVKTFL